MDIVFASSTAVVSTERGSFTVAEGSHWPANDPVVRAYPTMFTADVRVGLCSSVPVEQLAVERPVEQATAAPGERRGKPRQQ